MQKTFRDFPDFYNHPFIESIKNTPKWTVSDKNKRPIDMMIFKYQQRICGALFTDENSLVKLPVLCDTIPDATNNAFYLDALLDDFVVLDIEPECPDDIKAELLKLPYIYGETSLSGNGYHLVFPLPTSIWDYPIAQKKIVMKEKHKYYEILMNHWVTFTRNMLPEVVNDDQSDFISFFNKMASEQKETIKSEVDVSKIKPEDIPFQDAILKLLSESQPYKKTEDDFFGDLSTYEYAHMGFLYYKLKCVLNVTHIKKAHEYTDNEKIWLLYAIAQEKLKHRAKHDETRRGMPWLLYEATNVVANDTNEK